MQTSTPLGGGFDTPATQAAMAFRALMEAMARPGHIETVTGATPPAPLSPAAGAALLTLCDAETPLYLAGPCDTPALRDWLAFHVGAPLVGPADCAFAVGTWADLQPLTDYSIGTASYPDRSATLIVELDDLGADGAVLRGPGIKDTAALSLPEKAAFQANTAQFPLGLDFIFTSGQRLAALPRSTEVL
ncbi:phosphonate C-P lyase system protein PhnH [Roseovarius gahaiensis]|uniref:Phosphonate C-P lyase system protein PhnH n=1 Tax=Roseovarius gahaiensis TaxID=2716691 RepID=A0A967EGI5_9RHOB|nr:phosphonate C-P lyase system protein PhnH [Roseovarius gahaiensis]NHQ74675.1 phosphonate C-P lyase system protein PhnH [Roseovarius gahaiensis]